jgi:hypothetical protein
MDQINTQPQKQTMFQKCDQCGCNCRHPHSPLWRLFKVLLLIVVIFFVFVVGVAAGRRGTQIAMMHSGNVKGGMKQGVGMFSADGSAKENMMYFNHSSVSSVSGVPMMGMTKYNPDTVRVAGTVISIDGTKITLRDNGGLTQDVYSDSDTVVTSTSGEISASALKAKQFVVCHVSAKDGKKVADMIQVTQ